MEWKIGEIRQVNGEWYQCVEELSWGVHCNGCDFLGRICSKLNSKCSPAHHRSDGKSVIFKKLEKVGEPYFNGQYGEVLQEYKYYIPPITPDLRIHIIKLGIVGIEIKQNKEDMEEKKLNLKPFDIQKAREGKPVCTRDGRKARIICFDKKCINTECLIVLVSGIVDETIYLYTKDGKTVIGDSREFDLMMLPEKKEGWVNIYRGQVYNTFEKAEEARKIAEHGGDNYLKTIKIDWEE